MAYAFGTKTPNLYQSDYITTKNARIVRSKMIPKMGNSKYGIIGANYNDYNLFKKAIYLYDCRCRTSNTNNSELVSGLYNKMVLTNVCSVIAGSPCIDTKPCTACDTAVPVNEAITEPFYTTNTVDPLGILFGKDGCGVNNYSKFAVIKNK